jgi:hypothetical protein
MYISAIGSRYRRGRSRTKDKEMGLMSLRAVFIVIAVAVLVVGWYLFRPELLFIDRTVDEELPATASETGGPARAVVVSSGTFRGLAHETRGIAAIHRLADGRRILRLTEFETSNGPDVRVYLVAAADATDDETVNRGGFIDLGAMKGNRGSQNYDVPADADFGKYRSVSIWCRRFGVNFGAASLAAREEQTKSGK